MSCLNASPETVALAVLDGCERAVRGCEPDYSDASDFDAKFMASCIKTYASRARMLKSQAAAGWKPEFAWMLERCHSIAIDDVDDEEKEGVRTEKRKCMACGRWERCCKKALNAVGPFEFERFNSGDASDLQLTWQVFNRQYERTCGETLGASNGKLPECDFGEFTIGTTCLRKAELFFSCNTLIMECCYEAMQSCKSSPDFRWSQEEMVWKHATAENATALVERLRNLELAIADDRRPVPDWGVDTALWDNMNKERKRASGSNGEALTELLRDRAEATLETARQRLYVRGGPSSHAEGEEADGSEDYDVVGCTDDEEEEEHRSDTHNGKGVVRRRRRVLDSEDDSGDEEVVVRPKRACVQKAKGKAATGKPGPVRRSQRHIGSASNAGPSSSNAPAPPAPIGAVESQAVESQAEEEEPAPTEDAMRHRTRAPPPNAFALAQQQRVPGQRLPARREALFNLGTLQLSLMREGRDSDAAICTNAMFVMQELLARVDQLSHTAGI